MGQRVSRDELFEHCLAKPGAWLDEPWEDHQVVKVVDKIFASLSQADVVGVKCGASRDEADEWLTRYPGDAAPMRYLARAGWNSLRLDGAIPADEIRHAIDTSYDLVVARLPKGKRPQPEA